MQKERSKAKELFARKWKKESIDARVVKHQRQPSTARKGTESIVKEAKGQYRVLYAILASCGPMRAREALGLEIGKQISEDCRTRRGKGRLTSTNNKLRRL